MKYLSIVAALSIGLVSAQFNTTICDPNLDTNNRCNCDPTTLNCDCPIGTGDFYDANCVICPLEDFCSKCSAFDEVCIEYDDTKCNNFGTSIGTIAKTNTAGTDCYVCTVQNCQRCQFTQYCGKCVSGFVIDFETGRCVTPGAQTPTSTPAPQCPSFCGACSLITQNSVMTIKCDYCSNNLKKTNIAQDQCFYCTESACLHCDSDNVCSQCRNGYANNGGTCILNI